MILAGQSVVCVCVGGESYIDETLVGTVILPDLRLTTVLLIIHNFILIHGVVSSKTS